MNEMDRESPILFRSILSMSSLESDVLLAEAYEKLLNFRDDEKAKVITSWLAISFSDLIMAESEEALGEFLVHLKLFNTLVSNSSFEKASELADLFLNKFLMDFILPSVQDNSQPISLLSSATNFFRVTCENINQPLLVRKVIGLVMSHLLQILTERLLSDDRNILVSTLGLFKALLEFYCEDFWYELILQYLLPMKHLMVSERQKAIGEVDFLEASLQFINTIPGYVIASTSPESLAQQYVMYINQELARLQEMDSAQTKGMPLAKSIVSGIPTFQDESCDESTTSRNSFYPMWAFKYDGTDILCASRSFNAADPEEFLEDGKFVFPLQKKDEEADNQKKSKRILENSSLNNRFEMSDDSDWEDYNNASETQSSENESKSPSDCEISLSSTEDDSRSSSPNKDIPVLVETLSHPLSPSAEARRKDSTSTSHSSYFGPFIKNLYALLNKWTSLDPEVLIMISDIISMFAASRLPLLSSLFLDTNIILQPCYPSFASDIHAIAANLDITMKEYPIWFVKHLWQQASSGTLTFLAAQQKTEEQEDNNKARNGSTADVLKARVLNSRTFNFMSRVSGGSAAAISNLAKIITEGSSLKDNRVLNRSASGFESKEQEEQARRMTIRSILFTHWMLELSAIAHQQCWSQPQSRIK